MIPTPSQNVQDPLVRRFVDASAERLRAHARSVPADVDAPVVSEVLEALGRPNRTLESARKERSR